MENKKIEFHRIDKINKDICLEISSIFVDGFYQWLKYFTKNKMKLIKAFAHMFVSNAFYVAVENEKVLAIAACPSENGKSVCLNKKEFTKHLGFFIGRIAYKILHKEFEVKQYPLTILNTTGKVEFVATAEDSRGKGIAYRLLEYIITSTNYNKYVLEVASNNDKAINLYNRLGFKEIKRVKQKHAKKAGFEYLLYLQFDK